MSRRDGGLVPTGLIRLLCRGAGCFALALLAAGEAAAQAATGKLEGRLRDLAGLPLVEAQIYLVGTAYSAQTDPQGYYFINNIPAGEAVIRAALIGYHPVEVRNLRILAGQTITQDFTLEPAPVQLQQLTVLAVTAENALVPRDEVTTKQRVNGEFADQLPVDQLRALLALQPGVVADVDPTVGERQILSIRGGRPDEVVTYIDGVPVTPGYRSLGGGNFPLQEGTEVRVGTNGMEEASI
ncbi:MAG TPA: carboxypeptidase regulatory-like domain-containing protein, partial [Gemmatimonadales bacterium]|nr:carboxypeptidase regulatory-like domain-containing protein [Gemmatimonadales bacterium]